MNLPDPTLPQYHLQPGELLITHEPQWVITLLGSCVAVTMFHARLRTAAICHAMLPKPHGNESPETLLTQGFRYLSHAVPAMTERFLNRGALVSEIEVKVFGGANVIHMGGDPHDNHWIGTTNVAMARQLLRAVPFNVRVEMVGGQRGCKIVFNTETGQVLHKLLGSSQGGCLHKHAAPRVNCVPNRCAYVRDANGVWREPPTESPPLCAAA